MTNSFATTPITMIGATTRTPRETLAQFTDYASAQTMVDRLSDNGFPVETVQITGTGLSAVEYVTGRLTRARAAAGGAVSGLWFGFLFTLLFALFVTDAGLGLLFVTPLVAAAWGAAFGYVGHWTTRGSRDFSSISGFQAERFDVTVDADHADQARQLMN